MSVLKSRLSRNLTLFGIGTACIVLDGGFFDLFPSLILYMLLEYLWFESVFDPLRVMIVLMFHSIACFADLHIGYIVLFILYVLSLVWREYFLKAFVPFLIYSAALCVSFVFMKSHWIGAVIFSLLGLTLWRVRIEKV